MAKHCTRFAFAGDLKRHHLDPNFRSTGVAKRTREWHRVEAEMLLLFTPLQWHREALNPCRGILFCCDV